MTFVGNKWFYPSITFFYDNNVLNFWGFSVTLSHSKTVYVMTKWHLNRLKKTGFASCSKCQYDFNSDDVVATSASKRYCYECAIRINLVTGKITKDLSNDKFLSDVTNDIDSIGKKLEVNKHICKLAILLVNTAIIKKYYVSKNKIGLACAAIYLACHIKNQFILDIVFPVSTKILQMNTSLLQKKLTNTDIYTLSKTIHALVPRN
jgi:transcription initiation factor TFIIIB Brf1 subunit/transcription initiation factor TFIIB